MGKVVCQCQVDACELQLTTSPSGLTLHWSSLIDKKYDGSLVVAKHESSGTLYPVRLDSTTEAAIWHEPARGGCGGFKDTPSNALVCCQSGFVGVVHSRLPGRLVPLCHFTQAVVWAGTLTVLHTVVVAAVTKNGTLNVGLPPPSSVLSTVRAEDCRQDGTRLLWQYEHLPSAPVACCGWKDALIFSDGVMCWVGRISLTPARVIKINWSKLLTYGVIKIGISIEVSHIQLLTADGRCYQYNGDLLLKNQENDGAKKCGVGGKDHPGTLEGMMTGIQRCSKLIEDEGQYLLSLNLYLKQLATAHRLLKEPQSPLFTTSVRVECSPEHGNPVAYVQFNRLLPGETLAGQFWSLSIRVPRIGSNFVLSVKLPKDCDSTSFSVPVTLPPLRIGKGLDYLILKSSLVLEHFTSSSPVCQIFACYTRIDVTTFLTKERVLRVTNSSLVNNKTDLFQYFKTNQYFSSDLTQRINQVPNCQVSLSFLQSDMLKKLLEILLQFSFKSEFSPSENKLCGTVWFHEKRIEYKCSSEGQVQVMLEGPDPPIVLALKAAIEERMWEAGQAPQAVSLPLTVLRQALLTEQILSIEGTRSKTPAAISHLYSAVATLLSLLPLC